MMPQSDYGRYEGEGGYARQQEYNSVPERPAGVYDDEFVDNLAQRIGARMGQVQQSKVYPDTRATTVTAGMRLALAIVSLCLLVPLAAIIFGILAGSLNVFGGILGVVAFVAACIAAIAVNAIFSQRG